MTLLNNTLMSGQNFTLAVLGIEIPFRAGIERARIEAVRDLLEERFAAQKQRSHGGQSKEILLTFMALGLADDLLQLRKQLTGARERIDVINNKLEKLL